MPTFTPWRDGPNQLSNAAATVYTVPASTTTVIRCIIITNTDSTARNVFISIGTDAAGTQIVGGLSVAANTVEVIDCDIPLSAAEVIQAYATTANVVNVTFGGFTKT